MLQQISWNDYWKIIGMLTVCYECAILLLFYRQDILLLAKRKRWVLPVARNAASTETEGSTATEEEDEYADEDENLLPFAHDLSENIKAFITHAGDKAYVKEELCFGLQQRIKDYPQLNNTRYQREINTVIMVECKKQCAMHLRAGELDKLWLS